MTLPKKGLKTRPYDIGMEKRDLKKYDYTMYMDMEKKDLKKLTKGQLIKLLLKQEKKKTKVVIVDDTKPVPTPRNKVIERPVPKPRTKIIQIQNALKNSTKSFSVDIIDNKDPLHQLTKNKKVIEHYLNKELVE